jgi:CubicO group peptidase (beta-lactamase class C family)
MIASIDKLYNATIALLLSENGRLALDDPLSVYLPPTLTQGLHRYRGVDLTEKITLRHLLTHTSGLPDWLDDYPAGGGPSLLESIVEKGDRALTIEEITTHVRAHLRPHFPPQNLTEKRPKIRYSDTNFMLLIAIIEAVTGQPLHEVQQRMLYEPLGLEQTYSLEPNRPGPLGEAMTLRASGEPVKIPLLIASFRGVYSTADDMIAFLRGLVGGELFASPETLAIMQGNWRRFGFPLDRAALRAPSWPIEYGTGMLRFRMPRLFTLTAPSPAVLGHTGASGCWLFYCPELDVYLAGTVNEVTAAAVPFKIAPKILSIIQAGRV